MLSLIPRSSSINAMGFLGHKILNIGFLADPTHQPKAYYMLNILQTAPLKRTRNELKTCDGDFFTKRTFSLSLV